MQPEVGAVLEGKVSGVTKFGAFVNLPGDKSGLVHISEIANTFVSDVAQYVSVGQTVKVKVIGINGDKINLSIKRAEESKEAPRRRAPQQRSEQQSISGQCGTRNLDHGTDMILHVGILFLLNLLCNFYNNVLNELQLFLLAY